MCINFCAVCVCVCVCVTVLCENNSGLQNEKVERKKSIPHPHYVRPPAKKINK